MGLFKPNVAKIKAKKDTKGLTTALQYKDVLVRRDAASALRELGDPGTVEPLIMALKDEDLSVRHDAIDALGEIGDPRAVDPLIHELVYRDDKYAALGVSEAMADASRRRTAAKALGKIGKPAVEPLIMLLASPGEWVHGRAVEVLGEIGDPRAVEPLIEAMNEYEVRENAAEALGRIGKPAIEPLIGALRNSNLRVRPGAAMALGKIGDPRAVEPLTLALGDSDSVVRTEAARALGAIGDRSAVEPLIGVLGDSDRWVRFMAAGVLKELGWSPQNDKEKALYSNANEEWRKGPTLGESKVIEPLITALKDGKKDAARALKEIGAPAINPLVEELFKNNRLEVRAKVVEVLESLQWEPRTDDEEDRKRLATASVVRVSDDALGHAIKHTMEYLQRMHADLFGHSIPFGYSDLPPLDEDYMELVRDQIAEARACGAKVLSSESEMAYSGILKELKDAGLIETTGYMEFSLTSTGRQTLISVG